MIKPNVSIIIVNWNGLKNLKICLPSLQKAIGKDTEVVVVDNGSVDGSREFLETKYPKIKIVQNKKNLGFAEGNNVGFRNSKGKYILFLNNDTKVEPKFLKELVERIIKEKNIGGLQSKILLMEDKTKLDSIGAFFTTTGFLYHFGFRKKVVKELDREIELYSAKGACMLFRRSVLEKVKVDGEIMDSKYFAYFEETDLCHRVWMSGFKIIYCPDSVIYHKVGATSEKFNNSFVQYHSFKNRINSYIKNLDSTNLVKILPFHFVLCLVAVVSYLFKGKLSVSGAILLAFFWNLFNLEETLQKRKLIQLEIRKLEDSEFLPGLTKAIGLNYFIAHLRGLERYGE